MSALPNARCGTTWTSLHRISGIVSAHLAGAPAGDVETAVIHRGGIARRTPHPSGKVYAGGPQMVEISRDGKRVYWTNSLYSTWDNQFYPDGVPGAEVMANASPSGGLELASDYWVSFPDGYRAHQIRLEGGDCSTDSFCYPSV